MLFLFSFYLIIYLSLFSPVIHNIGVEFNNCYRTTNLNMIIDLFGLSVYPINVNTAEPVRTKFYTTIIYILNLL